MSKSAK